MSRFLFCFSSAAVLVIAGFWIWVAKFPMTFLDEGYAISVAKFQLIRTLPQKSVLIIGDSRARAGFIPSRLAPDTYNLALSGSNSLEVYFMARRALDSPAPPRAIIISISPFHCAFADFFWEDSVRHGVLDSSMLEEIRSDSRRLDDPIFLPLEAQFSSELKGRLLFGPRTPGDLEARLKLSLYSSRFPSYFAASFLAPDLLQRYHRNQIAYQEAWNSRGYAGFGMAHGTEYLCLETKQVQFVPGRLLDLYLSKTIELCQSRNVPVYFIAAPISALSAAALHPGFAADYDAYIKSFELRFANFHRLGEALPVMPTVDFGDENHLNKAGAEIFSDQVATLLQEAGIESKATPP